MSKLKKHFFLISALICAVDSANADKVNDPNTDVAVGTMPVNAIIVADNREFGLAQIAKAQQTAQANYFQKVDHTKVAIVDVIIQNVVHLGFMTPDQFAGPKTPQQLEEEAVAVARAAGVEVRVQKHMDGDKDSNVFNLKTDEGGIDTKGDAPVESTEGRNALPGE